MAPRPDLLLKAAHRIESGLDTADAQTTSYKVARATANWLRVEASTWNGDEAHYSCKPDTCSYESALELALAVLGGSGE